MTIAFQCDCCQHTLRVPDAVAGKRIRCPQCREVLRIPAVSPRHEPGLPGAVAADPNPPKAEEIELWKLKTRDGNSYGPVSREELDKWLAEGRITGECQLKQRGQAWQWASEVYPELGAAAAAPPLPPDLRQVADATEVAVEPLATDHRPATAASLPELTGSRGLDPPTGPALSGFAPRSYPAMRLTSRFYQFQGWLLIFVTTIALFLGAVLVLGSLVGRELADWELALHLGFWLLIGLLLIWTAAVMVISLWFLSEAIRCWMDIQDNTHRASFFLERLARMEQEQEQA